MTSGDNGDLGEIEGKLETISDRAQMPSNPGSSEEWKNREETERDTRFVENGTLPMRSAGGTVLAGGQWDNVKPSTNSSKDDFGVAKKGVLTWCQFLSACYHRRGRNWRKWAGPRVGVGEDCEEGLTCYLMSIHEHLQAKKELKEVGWAGIELVKLAGRDRQHFDCATWLHRARQMPKEDFKKTVEKELTGKETGPWEIVYFKLYTEPDAGDRESNRNGGSNAGKRPIPRLLPRNDLCGLPGRS
jgi:hypothetical protein